MLKLSTHPIKIISIEDFFKTESNAFKRFNKNKTRVIELLNKYSFIEILFKHKKNIAHKTRLPNKCSPQRLPTISFSLCFGLFYRYSEN